MGVRGASADCKILSVAIEGYVVYNFIKIIRYGMVHDSILIEGGIFVFIDTKRTFWNMDLAALKKAF